MTHSLRIAVADDEPDMLTWYERMIPRLGHTLVGAAANGHELIEHVRAQHPDLLITDIVMPELDGIEAGAKAYQVHPLAVIVVSAYFDEMLLARAEEDHVLAYLVKPIAEKDLGPAIAIAHRRFLELEAIRREADDLKQALADRKIIERAKGLLMKRAQIDEEAAFRRLQKLASDHNHKLVVAARLLLASDEAFSPPPAAE